jgi:hypothetical protein
MNFGVVGYLNIAAILCFGHAFTSMERNPSVERTNQKSTCVNTILNATLLLLVLENIGGGLAYMVLRILVPGWARA